MNVRGLTLPALLLAALVAAATAAAQSIEAPGGLTVHYSAQPTLALTPEVARGYAITRSGARGLLNLAVRRARPDGLSDAVAARVEGSATNLAGQRQELSVREVREGDAIYYLAEPRIGPGETLAFELQVTPQGSAAPILVRFRQEFHPPTR
jgi:hypothetical protein